MGKIKHTWTLIKDWIGDNRGVLLFLGLLLFSLMGLWHVFGWFFILAMVIGGTSYLVWNYENYLNTRIQDWINPLKWGSVLYASFMKMLFPMHVVEQLILRMYDNECRKCMANGKCFHCGCDMSKVYTPWDVCSKGMWGQMVLNRKRYREIREEWPVEIDIKYTREEEIKKQNS